MALNVLVIDDYPATRLSVDMMLRDLSKKYELKLEFFEDYDKARVSIEKGIEYQIGIFDTSTPDQAVTYGPEAGKDFRQRFPQAKLIAMSINPYNKPLWDCIADYFTEKDSFMHFQNTVETAIKAYLQANPE